MKKLFLFIFLLLAGSLITNAQWNDDPYVNNRITPLGAGNYDFEIGTAKSGATYINYLHPMDGNIASILQIVDKNGVMLFPEEGLIISHEKTISWTAAGSLLFIDRDDNAIIAVTDCRNSTGVYDEVSYSLYKVSPTGEMLWGSKGLDLDQGVAYNLVHSMTMAQLEDGSYVCAWGITNEADRTYIQMQRIAPTGEFLWELEEARLFSSQFDYEWPYLASAGNNQVILVFTRGAGRIVMARKIDFDASNVWAEDVTIYGGGFTIPPIWVILRVIPDQMGGAFVGWYDDRYWENKESTYVAHVTTNGTLGFASGEGGEKIGYNEYLRGFAPEMYFNKEEMELYVAFRETSQGQSWQQITAQKLKIPSGELMWDSIGIEVAPLEEQSIASYSIHGGKDGNALILYEYATVEAWYGRDMPVAILIDRKGEYVWEEEMVQFSTFVSGKSRLASTPFINNNFWVAVWLDERKIEGDPNGNSKIYAQRINFDGTLGDNGVPIIEYPKVHLSFGVAPTIISNTAEFHVNTAKTSHAEIGLYSMMGQKIESIYSGMLQNGNHLIRWHVPISVAKGAYIVTLTCDTGKKSLRILVQ